MGTILSKGIVAGAAAPPVLPIVWTQINEIYPHIRREKEMTAAIHTQ